MESPIMEQIAEDMELEEDPSAGGISTDLVPTLLNIYDALYAKFSDDSPSEGCTAPSTTTEGGSDTQGHLQQGSGVIDVCQTPSVSATDTTMSTPPPSLNITTTTTSPHLHTRLLHLNHHTSTTSSTATTPSSAPASSLYRPLSSISSTSSSSSNNSLPRQIGGGVSPMAAYLASVESLVEQDGGGGTRRRERSVKGRGGRGDGGGGGSSAPSTTGVHHQCSRPGSCDSGVVHCLALESGAGGGGGAPGRARVPCSTAPPSSSSSSMRHRHHHGGPLLQYMDRLVMEVLDTEALYVQGLQEVIQGYLQPWLEGADDGVSVTQAQELFSNLKEIHQFNSLFLREIQWCGNDPVRLADVFVRNNSGFTIYTHYCTHYPRTVSLLTELMRNETSVASFRRRQLALGHTLPLGSYLLKPVQRILKYHLLLENILKHFDKEKDVDGYNTILEARNAMTGMAHHINDMKRRHEHSVRVQEIQSLLYGWPGADLTTFGELAAEGTFRLLAAKGLRHVFLFSKMLLICKKKEENYLMYKTHIMCSNLMLIESIPREPLCFQVIPFDNPRVQYTLQARNRDHKHEWTQQLKRLILENYSADIPPHARQLVMELGRAKQDECSLPQSGGRRALQSSGPEYLQRRRRGRRASELPLNTPTSRLRLRRQSKDSTDGGRSRSVSRGRDTEEEEECTRERPKLRLNMWRRKSEPNVPKNKALSCAGSTDGDLTAASPATPSSYCTPPSTPCTPTESATPQTPLTPSEDRCNTPQVEIDDLSVSECADDGESANQENLEEIVSHLLQHNLHLQQLLLSKQRRGLLSRKHKFRPPASYETSDTENDDLLSHDSGLPAHSFNSLDSMSTEVITSKDDAATASDDLSSAVLDGISVSDAGVRGNSQGAGNYVDLYFSHERERLQNLARSKDSIKTNNMTGASTAASSDAGSSSESTSVYSSALSIRRHNSKETISESHGVFDFTNRRRCSTKKSPGPGYDSIFNMWSSLRGPSRKHLNSGQNSSVRKHDSFNEGMKKQSLRRVHSFNSELSVDKSNDDKISVSSAATLQTEHNQNELKDRRATIAVYDATTRENKPSESQQEDPDATLTETTLHDTEDNYTDCSESTAAHHASFLGFGIHPEHRIYTKAILSRSSLRNVISKLKHTRKTLHQQPEPVVSTPQPDNEKTGGEKTPSGLVYSMAKHCTKSIKERIKQIRSEDEDTVNNDNASHNIRSVRMLNNNEQVSKEQQIYDLPQYQQGSSTIGAKLAVTADESDYQVPQVNLHKNKTEETLQSSAPIQEQCKSEKQQSFDSSSYNEMILNNSSSSLEDFDEENSRGDSYYERSFEVIEDMLEEDLFRDSAIYSDPEDADGKANSADLKHFPKSILNRVSKSPSLRSDRYNITLQTISPKKSAESHADNTTTNQDQKSECSNMEDSSNTTAKEMAEKSETHCEEISNNTKENEMSPVHVSDTQSDDRNSMVTTASDNVPINLEKSDSETSKVKIEKLSVCLSDNPNNNQTSLEGDITQILEDNCNAIREKSSSPAKKVPPPIPAKPENVRVKLSKSYGSKIIYQLKNLEESVRYSKPNSSDTCLSGIKTLEQRRHELDSCKTDKFSVQTPDANHTKQTLPTRETTRHASSKPPRSPIMSVRSVISKSFAVNTSQSQRSSTLSAAPVLSQKTISVATSAISDSSDKKNQQNSDSSSTEQTSECLSGGVEQKKISITRRRSIKSLCNYVNKINSRSSSVPPRLSQRSDTRHQDASYSSETSIIPPVSNDRSIHSHSDSAIGKGVSKVPSSKSFPDTFVLTNASSQESGVVIEVKRPKGWVRHVVGRLQQTETAKS